MCFSVMQIFKSIGKHVHIGITKESDVAASEGGISGKSYEPPSQKHVWDMLLLNHGSGKCQVLAHGLVPL